MLSKSVSLLIFVRFALYVSEKSVWNRWFVCFFMVWVSYPLYFEALFLIHVCLWFLPHRDLFLLLPVCKVLLCPFLTSNSVLSDTNCISRLLLICICLVCLVMLFLLFYIFLLIGHIRIRFSCGWRKTQNSSGLKQLFCS